MGQMTQDMLLYDDGCPMCTFQMRVLTWLDWRHVIRLMPLSHPKTAEIAPSLDRQQLLAAIHCVTPGGTIHRGARAIRHLALRIPLLIPLAAVLWFPGVIWFAERAYMWVSRNRHLLSRFFGCADACSILPARKRDGDFETSDSADD